MKALGVKTYRFSISWPRVFPQGDGAPNPKGLDFYSRLVDELLANDIQPFATLYHCDLPQSLQDRGGGWESRDTANAFATYAGYVAERLTDRVKHIFTINEFGAFVELGYKVGIHAPGLKLPPGRFNQTRHPRGARARPRRPGDPRARQTGYEGRAGREHDHLR